MVAKRVRRVLRGYIDLTVIRSGPLWTLYRAYDVETSRWVAMRVIPARVVEEYVFDELAAEMKALEPASSHPNVATIYRYLRRRDGSAVVVTELCRESLADRIAREGRVPVADALRAAQDAAAALGAVHRAGVIHRDLRPSRLLVSHSSTTVVAGFGLAILGMAARAPNVPVSPHAAPELFEGTSLSPAADVYGLASTLYHLIGGRPAFEAFDGEAPASLILRIVGEPAPTLRTAGVPLRLADLIAAGMAKDPCDRPPSVAEFAAELSSVEIGERQEGGGHVPVGGEARAVEQRSGAEGTVVAGVDTGGGFLPPPAFTDPAGLSPPVRNVLAPLTAGRGARPLPPDRFPVSRLETAGRDLSGGDPSEPGLPGGPVARQPPVAGQPPLAEQPPVAGQPPVARRPIGEQRTATTGPAGHTPGVTAWLIIGIAALVVVLAALIIAGVV